MTGRRPSASRVARASDPVRIAIIAFLGMGKAEVIPLFLFVLCLGLFITRFREWLAKRSDMGGFVQNEGSEWQPPGYV